MCNPNNLEVLRHELDSIDDQIVRLIGERFEIIRKIGILKRDSEIPMMQPARVNHVVAKYRQGFERMGLDANLGGKIAELIIAEACSLETKIMDTEGNHE